MAPSPISLDTRPAVCRVMAADVVRGGRYFLTPKRRPMRRLHDCKTDIGTHSGR